MENTFYNISQVLGMTIIHSLWEGLLIWVILRVAFAASPALSPVKKYNLSVAAMLSIFACFIYTLYTEVHTYSWVSLKPVNGLSLIAYLSLPVNHRHLISGQFIYRTIAGCLPYVSAIYIAGFTVNLVKLGNEWNKIRLIKRSFIPAGQMQQFINTFSKKLGIKKPIQIKFSNLIDVPCMIGYFKPIIFLPVSIATYLSACEIEAILLHELSHIKRNDYLVNMLQQFINVILFFNPFALLINRIVNQERENSCDDLVVEKTAQPLIYAHALLKLEESRNSDLQFALSATGKKYHLFNRIERIMKTKKTHGNIRHLLIALFLIAGSLSCIAWLNPKLADAKTIKTRAKAGIANNLYAAPKPADTTTGSLIAGLKDTDKYILYGDTTKGKHKNKIVVVDKHGNKKEYDSIDSLPPELRSKFDAMQTHFNSPEWKAQMEQIEKQGEEMSKKFNSPEWKAQMEQMQKQGEEMSKKFNSPEWKSQMLAMQKQGEEMSKKFNSPEWKAQMEQMQKQGEEMSKKFNSPEWKAQMEQIQKQGEEMSKKFNSHEWKAQMEQMQKQGEEMSKQFNSPAWKAQMEQMQKQGEEMSKKFNSPEWKAQMEQMQKQGEEMSKKFNSPEWKAQMEQIQKQGEEMSKKFNSPEWKAQMEQMQKQGEEMSKKFNSPEWKAQMEQMQKQGEELRKQFDSAGWKQSMEDQTWILKDSTNGIEIYTPEKKVKDKKDKKTAPVKKQNQ